MLSELFDTIMQRSLSSWRAWIEINIDGSSDRTSRSLSSWRAWIEMPSLGMDASNVSGRSPHGERGLKCLINPLGKSNSHSRSPHGERGLKSRRGWRSRRDCASRSPHGERGLKFGRLVGRIQCGLGRSPHGERGLKCRSFGSAGQPPGSLSSWRAWIEIDMSTILGLNSFVALLMESVD